MSGLQDLAQARTHAIHMGIEDVPFHRDAATGTSGRLLQVDLEQGMFVVQNLLPAGYEVQTHRHTGPVWGITTSGAWHYKEYDYVNRAGSMLFEPAGSVHTLEVLEDTDAWFMIYGALLYLDENGDIVHVQDAESSLRAHYERYEAEGLPRPNLLVRP